MAVLGEYKAAIERDRNTLGQIREIKQKIREGELRVEGLKVEHLEREQEVLKELQTLLEGAKAVDVLLGQTQGYEGHRLLLQSGRLFIETKGSADLLVIREKLADQMRDRVSEAHRKWMDIRKEEYVERSKR